MQYTNELQLPEAFRLAVEGPKYEPSTDRDFFVTELIAPPQIRRLREKHDAEIVEDVADHVWRVFGQSCHSMLHLASQHDKNPEHFYEQRLLYAHPLTKKKTVTISGRIDVLYADEGAIYDWKTTSIWGLKDGPRPEWVAELNFYRLMAAANGYEINKLYAVAILRDFSEAMAKRNPDLPQRAVHVVPVPVWDLETTRRWVSNLIRRHTAKLTSPCTPEERWQSPAQFAVMREGRKTAVRVLFERSDAEAMIAELGPLHYIVERPGVSRRCASFCPVARWCKQWKEEQAMVAAGDRKEEAA